MDSDSNEHAASNLDSVANSNSASDRDVYPHANQYINSNPKFYSFINFHA